MQNPVEIWQPLVSGNPKGVDFMARIGIKAMVANTPEPARHERLTMYQQAAAKYGRELQLAKTSPSATDSSSAKTGRKPSRKLAPISKRP